MNTYICPQCGKPVATEQPAQNVQCPYCQCVFQPVQGQPAYGQPMYGAQQPQQEPDMFANGPSGKSRGVAALLAILLGTLGVHYFYLGKNTGGALTILLCICTCGIWSIIPFIQGILMFTMTQANFEAKYVNNNSTMPLF
ncbi:MAG: NINE protein [Muribaculaceae bacterium]|nr:NINE protein [Muribaculaceae bacterium]